jgi:uncharacterized iron-regulated membrane protein
MLYALALDWLALIVTIYVLYNYSVGAILNANAMSLSLMTLLALGTFVAGVQARVWRISAVGAVLLVAVPIIGWLDNSIMFLATIAILVIAVGGAIRWVSRRRPSAVSGRFRVDKPSAAWPVGRCVGRTGRRGWQSAWRRSR